MDLAVVVMATGMGIRMKSKLPKVLHQILGKPLLSYVLRAVEPLNPAQVVVVGREPEQVRTQLEREQVQGGQPLSFAVQSPQLGTSHAVQQAHSLLKDEADTVLVVPGDLPLLTTPTLQKLIAVYQSSRSPLVMLTVEADDPRGPGRAVRDDQGFVEEADYYTPEQKAIGELNVGVYVFKADWLWENLEKSRLIAKSEYDLTDLVDFVVRQGEQVRAEVLDNVTEAIAVNNRAQLADAEAALRQRINQKWMEAGVTMIDPSTTFIGLDVILGPDTVIYPNTYLYGKTKVGRNCVIGPNSWVVDSKVGDDCQIRFSVIEEAILEDNVDIGPFSHLRQGAHLAKGVHLGNFGEVKNSFLGPGTKMGHFSYVGDTTTGVNVNIGAGTITCNYDGEKKNHTTIGDNAFIGSDTMLVAPVNVGKNSKTGAGAVVTTDVPDNSLAYGVPARIKSTNADP